MVKLRKWCVTTTEVAACASRTSDILAACYTSLPLRIADEFSRRGIEESEFDVFVQAIPFQMYAILTVVSVPVVVLAKCDFGPMRRAERRVEETGEKYWPGSTPLREESADVTKQDDQAQPASNPMLS